MKKRQFALVALPILTLANWAVAQDDPATETSSTTNEVQMMVIADDESGAAPMVFSTMRSSSSDGMTKMQFQSGTPLMGGGLINFNEMKNDAAPDPFGLLGDPSVQKDLELVGDQLEKMTALQQSFSEKMKQEIGDLSKGNINPDRFQGIGEVIKRMRDEQQTQMKEMLLPHQVERLHQISVQRHLQNSGTAAALASDQLAKELGISDEQKDRLKKRGTEVAKELALKIEQLKEEAREKLLAELTSDQREKLKQMTGEKYKSDPQDWSDKMQRFQKSRAEKQEAVN